jgi:SnoaL-like domain
MKTKLYLALASIFAAVLVYALFFRASDEDRIRQKLAALEVAMKSGTSEAEAAMRPLRIQKAFASIFTPRVRADIPGVEAGDTPREELAALASSTAAQVSGLDVAFNQVHLEIDARAQPPRADVDALATVTGTTNGDVMKRRSIYQVTLHLEKLEGEWRISRVAAALTN